jgi:hypothetical protein
MKKPRLDDAIHPIRSIDFGDERNAVMTAIEEGIAQSPNIKNFISDLFRLFFFDLCYNPHFDDRNGRNWISRCQVQLAFLCYPTVECQFFSADSRDILKSNNSILSRFLIFLSEAFAKRYLSQVR